MRTRQIVSYRTVLLLLAHHAKVAASEVRWQLDLSRSRAPAAESFTFMLASGLVQVGKVRLWTRDPGLAGFRVAN